MKINKILILIKEKMYTMVLNEEFTSHDKAVKYVLKYLKKNHADLYIKWSRGNTILFEYDRINNISKGSCASYLNELLNEEEENEN